MRSILRFLWVVPILALGSGLFLGFLGAADDSRSAAKGTVLILRKGEVAMEGDFHRRNGQYVKKSAGGGETGISAKLVLRLCEDWPDAYSFMKSRFRSDDADGHLNLAKWCHINHLHADALHEAELALSLKPDHEKAQYACNFYKRMVESEKRKIAEPPPPLAPESAPPEVDVSDEAMKEFSERVQPILLQRCVECHNPNSSKQTTFHLYRLVDASMKQTTLRNLSSVLEQVDRERPDESALLINAKKFHGGMTHLAIRGSRDLQFEPLKKWVELVTDPHSSTSRRYQTGNTFVNPPRTIPDRTFRPDADAPQDPPVRPLPGAMVSSSYPRIEDGAAGPATMNPITVGGLKSRPMTDDRQVREVKTSSFAGGQNETLPGTKGPKGPPAFPSKVGKPQREPGEMARTAGLTKTLPAFPKKAALPNDLPRRQQAEAAPALKGPALAPAAQGVAAFHLHPLPLPALEPARIEMSIDEFDPGSFNQLVGRSRLP